MIWRARAQAISIVAALCFFSGCSKTSSVESTPPAPVVTDAPVVTNKTVSSVPTGSSFRKTLFKWFIYVVIVALLVLVFRVIFAKPKHARGPIPNRSRPQNYPKLEPRQTPNQSNPNAASLQTRSRTNPGLTPQATDVHAQRIADAPSIPAVIESVLPESSLRPSDEVLDQPRIRPILAPIVLSDPTTSADQRNSGTPVVSPQIGEQSAFAKVNWWDKDKDWCQLPSDGMSSDIVCDVGTTGQVAVAAASLRGDKHKVVGKPCEDAFNLRIAKTTNGIEYLIAVVCDGLSSAKYSSYGSRRSSQLIADELAHLIVKSEVVSQEIIQINMSSILESCARLLPPQQSNQYGAPDVLPNTIEPTDLNTTVTFLIIPTAKQPTGSVGVLGGSIGDSPIFVLRSSSQEWEKIGVAEKANDVLSTATAAFPGTKHAAVTTFNVDETDVVVATSDGVGNFLVVQDKQSALGSYLASQWIRPVSAATFVNDVGFDLRTADDDRTVVACWLNRE